MNYPTLFDMPADPLPVRSSDPATSKRAARDLPIRERQREVLTALRWLAVASDPADIRDCLANAGLHRERNEVASRLSELLRLGLVRKAGLKQGRKQKTVTTWALTDEGREAAK